MSDATKEPEPTTPADAAAAEPAPDPTPEPTPQPTPQAPAAEPKSRWRDRAFGFRSVVAVALATLILGGIGGTAIGVVASGDDRDRHGPVQMEFRDGDRPTHGGPGMPGFGVPPVAPPRDDVRPEDSGDTSGATS